MGGTSDGTGNVSAAAEYNIWVDPEAAKIVFDSGLDITMVGWDNSFKYAMLKEKEIEITLGNNSLFPVNIPISSTGFQLRPLIQPRRPFDFTTPFSFVCSGFSSKVSGEKGFD